VKLGALARLCLAGMLAFGLSSDPAHSDDHSALAIAKYEDYLTELYAAMSCGINVAEELVNVHSWSKAELSESVRIGVIDTVDSDNGQFFQDLMVVLGSDHYNALEDIACIRFRERIPTLEWPAPAEDDPVFRQFVMQSCMSFIPTYCPLPGTEIFDRMSDVTEGELGRSLDPSELEYSDGRVLNVWALGCGLRSYDASLDETGLGCQAMVNEMLSFGSYGAASDYVLPDPPAVADWDDDYRAYHAYFEVLIATRACGIESGARKVEVVNWTIATFDEHKHMVAFLTDDTLDALADRLNGSLGNLDVPLDCDGIMEDYLGTTWPSELP
jgi:hypothetical protein